MFRIPFPPGLPDDPRGFRGARLGAYLAGRYRGFRHQVAAAGAPRTYARGGERSPEGADVPWIRRCTG